MLLGKSSFCINDMQTVPSAMLAGRARYLILAPVVALAIIFYLGFNVESRPSSHSKLAAWRSEHNSGVWYHVDDVSGYTWQTDTFKEREDVLFDGVRRFIRTARHSWPKILFLVLTEDESSWGAENFQPSRTFDDFLAMLNSTGLNLAECGLGIMTSSEDEYIRYRKATLSTPLSRVTIILKTQDETKDTNPYTSIPRAGRHSKAFQMVRRANIALLRNQLQSRILHDERHIIWIDSDIKYLSPNIIQTMIHHSETKFDASVITALCNTSYWPDYDKNAFQGSRPPPASHRSADRSIADEEAGAKPKYVGELVASTDDELIPLDAVGGTILYIRASLIHQGLSFAPYYVVGTRWGRDGWDGIETQSLCYTANYLTGGGCWTLGRKYYVEHTST